MSVDSRPIATSSPSRPSSSPWVEGLRILLPLGILAVGSVAFVVLGRPQPTGKKESSLSRLPAVETVEARSFEGQFDLELEGEASTFREIQLAAEVSGRIVEKAEVGRPGSYVSEGALLIGVEKIDYLLEVERLEAVLRQAERDLAGVEVDLVNTDSMIVLAEESVGLQGKELARQRDLKQRFASSDADLDAALRMELEARQSLQSLRNQRRVSEQRKLTLEAARDLVRVQIKRAQVDLDRTEIRAPVDSTVISSFVEEGDFVRQGDTLLRLNDTSRVEIKCNLKLDELYWIRLQFDSRDVSEDGGGVSARLELPPTPVEVVFPFQDSEFVWNGVLSRYEGTGVDSVTRTVPCRVLVTKPHAPRHIGTATPLSTESRPSLTTGMYVSIRVPIDPPFELIRIPKVALRPGGEVWALEGGELRVLSVEVARHSGPEVLLRRSESGLAPGDRVVVSPVASVRNGMRVEEVGGQRR